MSVRPAIRMFSAISFGVFCRSAPSTSAIMRSRNVSPGFEVMRILMWSDSTCVPPVTALRSPPDSRMTGALSPVMTDSSTVATPSMTSPSPGMSRSARRCTMSPARSVEAGTCSMRPLATSALGDRVGLGLAQRVGLRLAARFGHRFGEVREQHREPEPQGDLQLEADAAGAGRDVADHEDRGTSAAPTSTTNMTGFFISVTGFSLTNDSSMARARRSRGSNSGRARASFFGSSDARR